MVTVDDVLELRAPTKGFLCPLSANTYKIDFLSFVIRDYDTKRSIFEVSKDSVPTPTLEAIRAPNFNPDDYRTIKYNFSSDILRTPTISTTLTFSVGPKEVEDFRMIERHYFRDRLVKSYDFTFGFCIPNSTNTWEAVYAVPLLEPDLVNEMVENPFETTSDSFYFVNDELVMHNKASYAYEDKAEAKTSGIGGAGSKAAKKSKALKLRCQDGRRFARRQGSYSEG